MLYPDLNNVGLVDDARRERAEERSSRVQKSFGTVAPRLDTQPIAPSPFIGAITPVAELEAARSSASRGVIVFYRL